VKLIFQRTLLSRFDLYKDFKIHNAERPVLFMADEYHQLATQLEDEPTGDSDFFSLARESGGFCIVATQTVEQLETSRLSKTWKAVFGTLAAVISMKGDDVATMEYLQKRAGDRDVLETTQGYQIEGGKVTIDVNTQRIRDPKVPVDVLKLFRKGDAVVVGTTTGHDDPASVRYVHVPDWKDPLIS
jgi:type IV secretory pathway TraG/TraD family ATPase VirD4